MVGLQATVVEATHEGYRCKGRLISESRNTVKIGCQGKTKTLPKDSIVLELDLPGKCRVRVDGRLLLARPEDRIKKKYRIRFV